MVTSICVGCGEEFTGSKHADFCDECSRFGMKIVVSEKKKPLRKVHKVEDEQDRVRLRKLNRPKRDMKKYAL